jgi:hypothetical protein
MVIEAMLSCEGAEGSLPAGSGGHRGAGFSKPNKACVARGRLAVRVEASGGWRNDSRQRAGRYAREPGLCSPPERQAVAGAASRYRRQRALLSMPGLEVASRREGAEVSGDNKQAPRRLAISR